MNSELKEPRKNNLIDFLTMATGTERFKKNQKNRWLIFIDTCSSSAESTKYFLKWLNNLYGSERSDCRIRSDRLRNMLDYEYENDTFMELEDMFRKSDSIWYGIDTIFEDNNMHDEAIELLAEYTSDNEEFYLELMSKAIRWIANSEPTKKAGDTTDDTQPR